MCAIFSKFSGFKDIKYDIPVGHEGHEGHEGHKGHEGHHVLYLASWDAIEPGLLTQSVSDSKNRVDWCDPDEWRYLLKTLLV